jgi:soluble lytic murein transglycosylase-like protein
VRRGWPTGAKEVLEQEETRRLLDPVEYDQALADIAAGYFAYNKDEEALAAATAAVERSGDHVPRVHWMAGLTLWRMGRLDEAAAHFEALAESEAGSAWEVAAGAYWAARAHLVAGRPRQVTPWLEAAAEHGRTFYGLLALRALGRESRFEWTLPALRDGALERVATAPGARRAVALLQVGRRHRAETELRKLYATADRGLADAVLILAIRLNLPGVAMRIGAKLAQEEGRHLDAALYPVPAWEPAGGFEVDRALIYAVMRQESRFNTRAKSRAGARGLMQIMPRTANFVADGEPFQGKTRDELFDPELNITLGQRYLDHLLDHDMVRGNLFLLAAAYNGGPGKLARWQRRVPYRDDPLLFIESIPSRETRIFIERILTNLWVYRQRLGQPTPSLDAIVAGDWPAYSPLDGGTDGPHAQVSGP